jgi:hypothetical protein
MGERIEMTSTELRLLFLLAENAGRVLSHRQLLEKVWGPEYVDNVDYTKLFIWRLRQKIEPNPGAAALHPHGARHRVPHGAGTIGAQRAAAPIEARRWAATPTPSGARVAPSTARRLKANRRRRNSRTSDPYA